MPKKQTDKERIEALEAALRGAGILLPVELPEPTERSDYIPYGSDRHRIWLGLELVKKDYDNTKTKYVLFTSEKTGQVYRLADELTGFDNAHDHDKAVFIELLRRVNVLEGPAPMAPPGATPVRVYRQVQ